MSHPQQPLPPKDTLPTMYDLPSEYPEDVGLPDEFHCFQANLLRETCKPSTYPFDEVLIGAGLNIHYDVHHFDWHKRPDWFIVLGVERARQQSDLRWSYVVWQEGLSPFLVIELLSPGTEAEDLGQTLREVNQPPTKWQTYEQILRVPYHAVFDRYDNQFQLYQLVGTRYQPLSLPEAGYWFDEMALGLGVWQGEYKGIEGRWLRWRDADNWVPTDSEQIEQAQQRSHKLAEQLRAMGVDPDNL